MPRPDRKISAAEKRIYRAFPLVQKAVRAGIYWSRESLVLGFAKLPAMMKQGQKIAAIRHYEREAGVDLTTAKDVVDRLIEPGR